METILTNQERTRALQICSSSLGDEWATSDHSETLVTKLSGGMSNLLYRCLLGRPTKQVPQEVLLRIYGPSYCDKELQIEIFNQLASNKLGPRLYATFEDGRLEEYLDSSPLSASQMFDDDISKAIAKKIAEIHKLEINNLSKETNWLTNRYQMYNSFITALDDVSLHFKQDTLDSTKAIARQLVNIDFTSEIEFLTSRLAETKEALVFSHNDLHQNNILLMHNNNLSFDDRVVLIDFEYCSYNYRAFDLANHLSEWCFDYNNDDYPFFKASIDNFPSEFKQKQFIRHYILQLEDNAASPQAEDSVGLISRRVDELFEEMQPCLLASNLLWAIWAIHSACTSEINFGYWEMAQHKWNVYLFCKERLLAGSEISR